MTNEFDPLYYAQQFETAGVPDHQATVHAQNMAHVVALMAPAKHLEQVEGHLRQDVAGSEERLNLNVDTIRSELLAKLELFRVTVDARIESLRVDLNARIDSVRHEVENALLCLQGEIGQIKVELRMLKWVLTIQFGATVAMLFKLFLP